MLRNPWKTETRCNWSEEIIAHSMCRRITAKDECFQVCFKHRSNRCKEQEAPKGSNLNERSRTGLTASSQASPISYI